MESVRLLDLFSGVGGAAKGYRDAGFKNIIGIDIEEQPNYPYSFIKEDAIKFLRKYGKQFDLIHASPPCQKFSQCWKIRKNKHPDFISIIRRELKKNGKPYVIENVVGSPLINPIMLCGSMFRLKTYRHRIFECSFPVKNRYHPKHLKTSVKMGRSIKDGDYIHIVGNFSGISYARKVMGINWATRDELRESIPPVYTEFIGTNYLLTKDS